MTIECRIRKENGEPGIALRFLILVVWPEMMLLESMALEQTEGWKQFLRENENY